MQHNTTQQMNLYSPDGMLEMGLELAGFDANKQGRVKRETNVQLFKSHYGSSKQGRVKRETNVQRFKPHYGPAHSYVQLSEKIL
jgi:hypothetical protein